jgi:hypothetical protein
MDKVPANIRQFVAIATNPESGSHQFTGTVAAVDRHRTSIRAQMGPGRLRCARALYLNTPLMMIAAMKVSAAIRSNPPMIFLFKVPLR